MTVQEFYGQLDSMLDLPAGSIKGTEYLGDLEAWDSLTTVSFIAFADEELGTTVDADRLASCVTVADLLALVSDRLQSA